MNKQSTKNNCLPTEGGPMPNDLSRRDTPKKILVVEDEFLTALNIRKNLTLSGYEVAAIAKTGKEAVRLAAELLPDLILMDITLKGPMTGIEAAAEISKDHAIPIIYLTAHADTKTIDNSKTTEPFGYLAKPCSVATIISTIEVALNKSKVIEEVSKAKNSKLQEANIALKVLGEHLEMKRREFEHLQISVSKLVGPSLEALESTKLSESQRIHVKSIKNNLQPLTDGQQLQLGKAIAHLSTTEMQVATFVRAGKSTKEIAQFLNIATSTINSHRDSIRKKMGIKNTKTNLKKELQKLL